MKNKQQFKLSDETIKKFDISEVTYENGQESFDVLLKVKGIKSDEDMINNISKHII